MGRPKPYRKSISSDVRIFHSSRLKVVFEAVEHAVGKLISFSDGE